jgi:hypothetical protein
MEAELFVLQFSDECTLHREQNGGRTICAAVSEALCDLPQFAIPSRD